MTVDEIYQLVAQNIYANIPVESWNKAILKVQGDSTAMRLEGIYAVNEQEYPLNVINFDVDVEFALMEFHEITTEDDSNLWNNAIFTLMPDGLFNVDLSYIPDNDEENI